jgi:hypothetical protein
MAEDVERYHRGMPAIVLALLLQTPMQAPPTIDLPVSLDRIREGLARKPIFEVPPRRPFAAIFRVRVEGWVAFEDDAWEERSTVPLFAQPSAPPVHFEFLQSTTPEEVRASTVHPCCDVMPAVSAVGSFVKERVRSARERRAKGEVEQAMRAAGIKR